MTYGLFQKHRDSWKDPIITLSGTVEPENALQDTRAASEAAEMGLVDRVTASPLQPQNGPSGSAQTRPPHLS